jgi:hypothetical protein
MHLADWPDAQVTSGDFALGLHVHVGPNLRAARNVLRNFLREKTGVEPALGDASQKGAIGVVIGRKPPE